MSVQRISVVTGGSRGIGLAIVKAFLNSGSVKVYNLDIVPPEDEASQQALQNEQLVYLSTDVSDTKLFLERLESIFDRHQQLDCLVNNAGIFECSENNNVLWNDDATTSAEQVDSILRTNLGSVVHGTRMAVQLMRKMTTTKEGCRTIINIASTAAFGPFPMHPVYCSTKSAVLQFTQTARVDLQPEGFRVHCVCPGIIDTDMGRLGGDANRQAVAQLKGGKRTKPELVASAVLQLFERHAKWNNCFDLIVDNHEIRSFPLNEG